MSYLETDHEQRLDHLIDQLAAKDRETVDYTADLLRWALYGPSVFSQFGLGLRGYVFRQHNGSCVMTVKCVEGEVPLVAFVTSATPRGCIEQMFDLLFDHRLKWQKDKYPWT